MAHIVLNAMSLRKGGGLQVMQGLVSRLDGGHRYTVLWTDPAAGRAFQEVTKGKEHIRLVDPLGRTGNMDVFAWCMRRQAAWLAQNSADCVFGINHHYPSGKARQVIYHINVLRFSRPRRSVMASGEIAERLRDWRARTALLHADANVFESHMLMEIAGNSLRSGQAISTPHVVYIGLDETGFSQQPFKPDYKPTILAVTSPAPHKDNATLVAMLGELVRMDPETDWRLDVAGGRGPADFPDMVELAARLEVSDRIRFLGFTGHDELARLGRQSLCLVSPSLFESFCMVALEAMSWGCPAIVANASCMPESVGDAGILADPSNAADFARHVIALHGNPQLRAEFVERGRRRAASMTWTSAARQMEAIIDEALRGEGRT